MERRQFLTVSLLGAAGAAAPVSAAKAFHVMECAPDGADAACRQVAEHGDILQNIDALLAEKGMSAAQRQILLAAASCPFCGLPLVAAPGGGF